MRSSIKFLILLLFFSASSCFAGKIDEIIAAVSKSCGKLIEREKAMAIVSDLFVGCSAGQKVKVLDDCEVKCLKENSGAVVGQ